MNIMYKISPQLSVPGSRGMMIPGQVQDVVRNVLKWLPSDGTWSGLEHGHNGLL